MSLIPTPPTVQRLLAGTTVPRHAHADGYLAVVLQGRYWEANGAGRRELRPGDVAIHAPYAGHCNSVARDDALVLNVSVNAVGFDSFARLRDLDALQHELLHADAWVGADASRAVDVSALIESLMIPSTPVVFDWPDQLASALQSDPSMSITGWAQTQGLAIETVSRGFRRVYGASPKRVRFEHRTRRALSMLMHGDLPLAEVAIDAGFPDQSSMTRAIRNLTGWPPLTLRRRSSGDKTARVQLAKVRA